MALHSIIHTQDYLCLTTADTRTVFRLADVSQTDTLAVAKRALSQRSGG